MWLGHASVTIEWDASADSSVTRWVVLRRDRDRDAVGELAEIVELGVSQTSFADSGVEPATRYAYRVQARNAAGLSVASRALRVTTPAAPKSEHTDTRSHEGTHDGCGASTGTSCSLTLGVPTSGSIRSDHDEDWFRVSLQQGQIYKVVVRADNTAHRRVNDPWLTGVYDREGRLLDVDGSVHPHPFSGSSAGSADHDSGPGDAALNYFTAAYTGPHYIGAASGGGLGKRHGHYVVEVNQATPEDLAGDDYAPGKTPAALSVFQELELDRRFQEDPIEPWDENDPDDPNGP